MIEVEYDVWMRVQSEDSTRRGAFSSNDGMDQSESRLNFYT
jgi:hypothetical protein